MTAQRVPVMRPRLPRFDEVAERLRSIDRSGWYTNFGPQEAELRTRFAAFFGVGEDRVATVSSATLGIQGAASVSGATSWVVPSFTFAATPSALLHGRNEIRFADIRVQDWWIDDAAIDDDPAEGVVAVAPFGAPLDLDSWDPHREVIIDAAASIGADVPALEELPPGWAVVFSLHATKCLPAGEGGVVVFGDPDRARTFRSWTNFGFGDDRQSDLVATNAKMSEVSAAFAHASLDTWDVIRAEWSRARRIADHLEDEHRLTGQPGARTGVSPYWIVEFDDAVSTDAAEAILASHGVETRRWWSAGCHRMPAFKDVRRASLGVSEDVARRSLGLPMFRDMDEHDAGLIANALNALGERGGR